MKFTLALPVALAVVLAARFIAGPLRGVPDYDNADFSRFVAAERYELHNHDRDPEAPPVLLLGSSRTQYGFEKATFATALGVSESQVRNLSVPDGNPWSSVTMLRRNPNAIKGAKLICIDVAPIQFNGSYFPLRNRFAHLATLSERLRVHDRPDFRNEQALDYFTGHLGIRRSLKSYGMAGVNIRRDTIWGADDKQRLDPVWVNENDHEKIKNEMFAENKDWRPENYAGVSYNEFQHSRFLYDALLEVESLAAAAGAKLVIHQPPFHPEFIESIKSNPEWDYKYTEYIALMKSRQSENVTVLIWDLPEELGIPIDGILDYGHFGRAAAEEYSRKLAAEIQASE